ncbi:MAG: sulfatase-like hydrolase/transferase [Armatimonadota bacterium]|nr:sulfatase-like hydrolase/transferase [Armatimonadota bacterium]
MQDGNLTRREVLKRAAVLGAYVLVPSAVSGESERASDSTGQKKRPNFLFVFPDQHRFDWVPWNPKVPVRMPNLEKLAARGVRFNWAFTPSPLCAPARACLASGREYERCGVKNNDQDYPIDQTTFYKLLRDDGYWVMGCGKFDLHKASPIWGIDGKNLLTEWGFSDGIDNAGKQDAVASGRDKPRDPYMAFLERRGLRQLHVEDYRKRSQVGKAAVFPTPLPDDAYCDNWVGQNALELIRKVPAGKPWFLQVNFVGPHPPWDITESMTKLYQDVEFPQPNGGTQLTPEQNVAVRRNYSAMVTNIDRWLGLFVDELASRGELDNTFIIYSSDHGEMLNDHGLWGKSVPYQPSVGVPLVIAGPSVRKGLVTNSPTSLIDLTATILDYAGINAPPTVDGISLRPVLEGKKQRHRDYVRSGLNEWRLVFDGRYKLVRGYPERDDLLLFDLEADPEENRNLAATHKDTVERLSVVIGPREGEKK